MKPVRFTFAFLVSCFISCMAACLYIKNQNTIQPEVLADTIEVTPSPQITLSPTASPSPSPTIKPTTKPTPTLTIKPTASPSPTIPPIPTATPDVWSPGNMTSLFAQYAGAYGVDQNILERLANCESHFNQNAQNGDYLGMFQFSTSLWQDYRRRLGMDINPDLRRNIEESIRTASFVISQRGTSPWPSCL